MERSASIASRSDGPTCRERRPDGLGESRMQETRTSGLTSGDRKRGHVSPDCGGGAKAPPATHREANATAPVLDSTHLQPAVVEVAAQPLPVPQTVADRARQRRALADQVELRLQPAAEVLHQRRAARLPHGAARFGRLAPDLALDGV